MTKEELKKEAEEKAFSYAQLIPCSPYMEKRHREIDFKEGYFAGAEPREKQIAELEKENAELKKKCYKKAVKDYCELEKENAELKCECRRCVYTDSSCVLSDYGKDKNGICDHFKDVFDENAELKSIAENQQSSNMSRYFENKKLKEALTVGSIWNKHLNSQNKALEEEKDKYRNMVFDKDNQLTKAKELLERLLITSCNSDVLNLLPNCSEVLRVRAEAEQFLMECEK